MGRVCGEVVGLPCVWELGSALVYRWSRRSFVFVTAPHALSAIYHAQVKELGLYMRNCPMAAADFVKVLSPPRSHPAQHTFVR